MDQLTTLDAGFLKAEDSDPPVRLAIGGLVVPEGPAPDRESLTSTLAQRIGACPRFKQRLRSRPFGLGAPEWVDDPGFDLAHHIRRIAVPRPGDDPPITAARQDRSGPIHHLTDALAATLTGKRAAT